MSREWYTPTTADIRASATRLGEWHPKAFNLWMAEQRKEIRRELYDELIAEFETAWVDEQVVTTLKDRRYSEVPCTHPTKYGRTCLTCGERIDT